MKFFIVFAALFAVALAAPRPGDADTVITSQDSEVDERSFKFDVNTSDGFNHNAQGQLKDEGSDHEAIVVHGSYTYVGDDGVTYSVKYTADENGFQPEGAHLPVGPEA